MYRINARRLVGTSLQDAPAASLWARLCRFADDLCERVYGRTMVVLPGWRGWSRQAEVREIGRQDGNMLRELARSRREGRKPRYMPRTAWRLL